MRNTAIKTKKILSILVVAVMFTTAMLPQFGAVSADDARTVTIFHTNDVHGRFVESSTAIGIDTIAAIHAAYENSILVDAGDTFHGVPFVNFNEGRNGLELMNMAGYSLFTPGNHDFNFGFDNLLALQAAADFDFIAANLTRNEQMVFDGISVREINGVRLGFFGLAYPGTPETTHPDNVRELTFIDPIEAARQSVSLLQAADVDVIIALAHLGVDGSAWGRRVAEAVTEIDLIIDGHSHTALPNGELVGDVLLAQAGAHNNNLGRVDIVVTNGEVVSITASVIDRETALENYEPVAEITARIAEMNAELGETLNVVVGYSPVTFYGDSPEHRAYLRNMEVPIGNLVADSMRWGTGSDLTLTNSGGIRAHLHAGEITKGDVIEVLAFFNYAVVLEITPAQLRLALENGVSNMPGNGRFPQISGFSFVFDQNAEEGNRVRSITVNGQALDLNDTTTTFTLTTNNFMAAGGDGYAIFVELPVLLEGGTQDELLIAYLSEVDLTTVVVEGRIINLATLGSSRFSVQLDSYEIVDLDTNTVIQVMDVRPVLQDNRTLVPIRFIAETLGADVDWNEGTQEVTLELGGNVLTFAIGELAEGMDVPAQILYNRTFVPLRFVSEFFGANVEWFEQTRTIEITAD